MDRRTTIKWMFAAAATVPSLRVHGYTNQPLARDVAASQAGYGTDPDLVREWNPGGPWPLTLGVAARLTTAALCDLVIPADESSPAASSVGVVDFIDEWISAPYPEHAVDRKTVLDGLSQIEGEAQRRFKTAFAKLSTTQLSTIADAMVKDPFFERYRALTAGGFYTTPVGVKDLKYVGNVAMATFEGPTQDVLKRLGLA